MLELSAPIWAGLWAPFQAGCESSFMDRSSPSSIRAQIPGLLNHGADILSRNGVPHGEWRLHPSSVWMTWGLFWKAEVDLFMTSENTHWPLFFSLVSLPTDGKHSRRHAGQEPDFMHSHQWRFCLWYYAKSGERESISDSHYPEPNQPWFQA